MYIHKVTTRSENSDHKDINTKSVYRSQPLDKSYEVYVHLCFAKRKINTCNVKPDDKWSLAALSNNDYFLQFISLILLAMKPFVSVSVVQ